MAKKRALKGAKFGSPIFVIALAADAVSDENKPVWVEVAREGTYKGYDGGNVEFTFDRELFTKVVENFRRKPTYSKGANGYGETKVLAWDFHHASELHPATVASSGAPAQGWTLDLEVRDGEKGAELWALVHWLEPLRTYIKEERYRWASVSMHFDAVDAITGEHIGPEITSIAATNNPFIEGMAPLAASRGYYPMAGSPEEALGFMRGLFGLPALATAEDVNSQLAKLESMVGGASSSTGVDLESLVCDLRSILGLPVLTDAAEVLAKSRQVVSAGSSIGATEIPTSQIAASTDVRENPESTEMDLKVFASKLGVREAEKAVESRIDELLALETSLNELAKVLGATVINGDTKALLDSASRAQKAAANLASILKACGVEQSDAALAKITELFATAEAASKAMPELESLRALAAKAESEAADADVAHAMASRGLTDEGTKLALTMLRQKDPKTFAEKFPKIDPAKAHLTSTVVASAKGAETPVAAVTTTGPTSKYDLSKYPGANATEKAMAYVRGTIPGADKWTLEAVTEAAWKIVREIRAGA